MPNALQHTSSLYLQQHQNNPVNWFPWSAKVWEEATRLNKLVIVSIGYSSCHWCHVMERESFENQEVADVMNAHYLSIKVDREERPDIDSVYMTAVQLMAGQGGWPLNVVCTPDKRPIWGGTYFPKENWTSALLQIQKLYRENPEKVRAYADQLEEGLRTSELVVQKNDQLPNDDWLKDRLQRVEKMRDTLWGGHNRQPKFPMPYEQLFYLQAADYYDLKPLEDHIHFTLTKMACGGIYDFVGGGFCRYSVDGQWKVPHFEKMLYDNAQLLTAYSIAHRRRQDDLYLSVISGIFDFLQTVFRTPNGLYQSAIDADSEGVEGKYYVWQKDELQKILGADYSIWETAFDLEQPWEGNFIIFRKLSNKETAIRLNISLAECEDRLEQGRQKLLKVRNDRISPAIDNKVITAWNGLLLTGLVDAYLATGNDLYLNGAKSLEKAIFEKLFVDGKLYRIFANEKAYIPAMLEDYAALCQGLLSLFQVTGDADYYQKTTDLIEMVFRYFSEEDGPFFQTTSTEEEEVLMRTKDLEDNVIPSPNAIMAEVLRKATQIHHRPDWDSHWQNMVIAASQMTIEVKSGFYLWGQLYLRTLRNNDREWVISGIESQSELVKYSVNFHDFFTDLFVLNADLHHDLFQGRFANSIRHFICEGKVCKLPLSDGDAALETLQGGNRL
ncbi:MAG: thioredoxin domain-containing protein [Cryomorphaceae bacterium]|nr:thioredoxin domain-containing protein [Cryomorphaceae bacterium]